MSFDPAFQFLLEGEEEGAQGAATTTTRRRKSRLAALNNKAREKRERERESVSGRLAFPPLLSDGCGGLTLEWRRRRRRRRRSGRVSGRQPGEDRIRE